MDFLILHIDVSTVLGNSLTILVSFIILMAILSKFAIRPLMDIIEKREKNVNEQLDNAAESQEKAQKYEQEAKQAVQEAQIKAQHLVTKAKEAGDRIKNEASQQARQETVRIRQEAQVAIENERQVMLKELSAQVADVSVDLTKRLLKRELNAQDHQRLIEEFIEGLEQ